MMLRPCDDDLLAELVRANQDVETAFTVCAHTTRNEHLGAMLLERALLCGRAARELVAVRAANDRRICADTVSSAPGAPDWMALQAALAARDDASVRDECVRTEEETLMRFRDTFEHDLPAHIRRIVQRYFAALLHCHGGLRHLDLPAPDDSPSGRSLRGKRARIAPRV